MHIVGCVWALFRSNIRVFLFIGISFVSWHTLILLWFKWNFIENFISYKNLHLFLCFYSIFSYKRFQNSYHQKLTVFISHKFLQYGSCYCFTIGIVLQCNAISNCFLFIYYIFFFTTLFIEFLYIFHMKRKSMNNRRVQQ